MQLILRGKWMNHLLICVIIMVTLNVTESLWGPWLSCTKLYGSASNTDWDVSVWRGEMSQTLHQKHNGRKEKTSDVWSSLDKKKRLDQRKHGCVVKLSTIKAKNIQTKVKQPECWLLFLSHTDALKGSILLHNTFTFCFDLTNLMDPRKCVAFKCRPRVFELSLHTLLCKHLQQHYSTIFWKCSRTMSRRFRAGSSLMMRRMLRALSCVCLWNIKQIRSLACLMWKHNSFVEVQSLCWGTKQLHLQKKQACRGGKFYLV